jgi:hypothetical protein
MADLEDDVTEFDPFAVGKLAYIELSLGDRRVGDLGTSGRCQFEVARQEVSMEVRFDDELDGEAGCGRIADVFGDVTAWVDNDGSAACLVTDQVRGLREAVEVVLREDHREPCANAPE